MAETAITKLAHQLILGQKVKGQDQGHNSAKRRSTRIEWPAWVIMHTLSSAHPLVILRIIATAVRCHDQTLKPGFHSNATQAIAFEWKPGFNRVHVSSMVVFGVKVCQTHHSTRITLSCSTTVVCNCQVPRPRQPSSHLRSKLNDVTSCLVLTTSSCVFFFTRFQSLHCCCFAAWWTGGVVVKVSDLQPIGRRFESLLLRFT